jgi:deoxyribonuclease-4
MDTPMLFGRHMPLGGKPLEMPQLAHEIGCEAAQIFVTNPRGWRVPDEKPNQALFREAAEQHIRQMVVHAAYLINLASPRRDFFEQSLTLLAATLERAGIYGCSSVVFHIGSHIGSGEDAGLKQLVEGIKRILDADSGGAMLLLENDVGGGGKLGYRLENLAAVLDSLSGYQARLGVCLDTAHLWGAGYDIGTPEGVDQTLRAVESTISLARVPVIHLNDTAKALGSHLDVHARIGEGIIPGIGLSAFLQHPSFAEATVILETPIPELAGGKPDWAAERRHLLRARALAVGHKD